MLGLLQSFTAVLEEFGVSHGRAKQAAVCAAEGLMIVRGTLSWPISNTELALGWTDSQS